MSIAVALCGLASVAPTCFGANSSVLPSANTVLKRLLDRADKVARGEVNPRFCYTKRTINEELDSRGRVVNSTEKKYNVVLIQGWTFDRLVEVQGRHLSEAELRKEEQREQDFRSRIEGREVKQRKDRREAVITPELLARYHFIVLSNAFCDNRNTFVLEFKPKPGNPEKTIEDKILNRFAGLLWIDSEDSEIARLDVHLTSDLSLGWLGMIGSLKECKLHAERQKTPQGVWVNRKHTLNITGRKVLTSMRFRSSEEASDFHPSTQG